MTSKGSVYFSRGLVRISLILWIIGSPAAGGSQVSSENRSCEAILAPQVEVYTKLVRAALRLKIISEQDLAKLTVDNLNPLQGKERTHQNIALHQGLAKTVNALADEAKEQVLSEIAKIRGVQASDAESTLRAKRDTEYVFAPELEKTITGVWPHLDGLSKHSEIFFHQDDAGDWLVVAEQTRIHVINIQDPSLRREIDDLPLMTRPKGLTSRDGKFYLAFINLGKPFVLDLSSGTITGENLDETNVENINFVEDKSGRRFLLAHTGPSHTNLKVFEHTDKLKLRSEVYSVSGLDLVDLMFDLKGGIFLPHFTIVWNNLNNTPTYFVEVFDLVENKVVQRWPVDSSIRRVIGIARKDGSFAIAATQNDPGGSPILFFQTGSKDIKSSADYTFDDSVPRWHETQDGRLLFSVYSRGPIVGISYLHIYEPFPLAAPIGKVARLINILKKQQIQMVPPLFAAARNRAPSTSGWGATKASNESFWIRLEDKDVYVEALGNAVQKFVWLDDALHPIGNSASLVTDRAGRGLSVFDPHTRTMYVAFDGSATASGSVWWSSHGIVKSLNGPHDLTVQALAISRTGEVIYAVAEPIARTSSTRNILIYKLTRSSERQEP